MNSNKQLYRNLAKIPPSEWYTYLKQNCALRKAVLQLSGSIEFPEYPTLVIEHLPEKKVYEIFPFKKQIIVGPGLEYKVKNNLVYIHNQTWVAQRTTAWDGFNDVDTFYYKNIDDNLSEGMESMITAQFLSPLFIKILNTRNSHTAHAFNTGNMFPLLLNQLVPLMQLQNFTISELQIIREIYKKCMTIISLKSGFQGDVYIHPMQFERPAYDRKILMSRLGENGKAADLQEVIKQEDCTIEEIILRHTHGYKPAKILADVIKKLITRPCGIVIPSKELLVVTKTLETSICIYGGSAHERMSVLQKIYKNQDQDLEKLNSIF